MRFVKVFFIFSSLLSLSVGCKPVQPSFVPGTYTTDLAIEELPESFGPPWNADGFLGSTMVGHWEITFSENGRVFWKHNGANNAEGTYSVTSSTLEFGFKLSNLR